jgi:hypothetical protein
MSRSVYYYKSSAVAQVLIMLASIIPLNASQDNYTCAWRRHAQEKNVYTATVYQNAVEAPATALVLFLVYDSHKATLLQHDASGNHVQLAQQQQDAGFILSETLHTTLDTMDGNACLAIAIYRTSSGFALNPGELFSFSLELLPNAVPPVIIEAATAIQARLYRRGTALASSASTAWMKYRCPYSSNLQVSLIIAFHHPRPCKWKHHGGIGIKLLLPGNHHNTKTRWNIKYTGVFPMIRTKRSRWHPPTPPNTHGQMFSMQNTANVTPPAGCSCTTFSKYYYWVRARDALSNRLFK